MMVEIPSAIKNILSQLNQAGFEAYIVGGCVRDLIMENPPAGGPKDWDIATNALPEQIQQIFSDSFYENTFGTVGVKIKSQKYKAKSIKPNLKTEKSREAEIEVVEVTTYRADGQYTDKRHPDGVRFTGKLEEDLARRDFTINAMAMEAHIDYRLPTTDKNKIKRLAVGGRRLAAKIIDPFNGQEDLKKGLIRAVGDPRERFNEDALRMMRAVRFAVELSSAKQGFKIEEKTKKAIQENAVWLQAIAKERIKDELIKIIMTDAAADGMMLLHELSLLRYIMPELEKGIGVAQNRHHIYTIYEHGILSLKFAASRRSNLTVRLAALLHDIAKPQTKRGVGLEATFYNHDLSGARVATQILDRLRFPRQTIEAVANLIRNHMFVYDVGAVSEAGVRRVLRRVGPENFNDLIALRVADRLGSGVPKAQPYRLRHFQYMAEKVQHDAISVKQLRINGTEIMDLLKIEPGPKIGAILDVLLAEAIEEPAKNKPATLKKRVQELNKIDLTQLRQMAKERIKEKKEEEDAEIKGKYWVK